MDTGYKGQELNFLSPYVRHATLSELEGVDNPKWISNESENLLLYVVEGGFLHTVNGACVELTPGVIRLVPPYAHQMIGSLSTQYAKYYCVYFDLFDSEESRDTEWRSRERHLPSREMLLCGYQMGAYLPPERRDDFVRKLDLLVARHEMAPPMRQNLILKGTMLLVLADFFSAEPMNLREVGSVTSQHAAEAMHYADHNFDSPSLSVAEIAAHMGISAAHLSRLVRRETNKTLSEYITFVRIQKAKDLFALGWRISDTALKCGFGSLQAFSRAFHRMEGVSPREYIAMRTAARHGKL